MAVVLWDAETQERPLASLTVSSSGAPGLAALYAVESVVCFDLEAV